MATTLICFTDKDGRERGTSVWDDSEEILAQKTDVAVWKIKGENGKITCVIDREEVLRVSDPLGQEYISRRNGTWRSR